MLLVWSQWLLASQALLENAWEQDDLTRFGDHHDHDTRDDHDDHDTQDDHHDHDKRDDHDGRDDLARMPRSLKRVKNELIHSQSDIVSLIFLLQIIVLCMISRSDP